MRAVGAILLVAGWMATGWAGGVRAEGPPAAEDRAAGPSAAASPSKPAPGSGPSRPDSAAAPAASAQPATSTPIVSAAPAAADSDSVKTVRPASASAAPVAPPPTRRKQRSAPARAKGTSPAVVPADVGAVGPGNGPLPPILNMEADASEAGRVAREIARTALWLSRAASQVPRSHNSRASDILASAREFQVEARDAFEVQQYARAQRLTQVARDYADRAIRLAGPATDDPEYVNGVLRRTDDALDRLKEYLAAGGTPATNRRYEELKEEQKEARRLLDEGNVREANDATTRVRDGVLAVLRQAPPGDVPCGSAQRAIENAEASRENVRKEIGRGPDATTARYLSAADFQLSKAHALLARKNCRDAVLRAKAAERQLEKAIDASRQAKKTKK